MSDIFPYRGYIIVGGQYQFGLGRDGILNRIHQLGDDLKATCSTDNTIVVVFEGHGNRYKAVNDIWHYRYVTTQDEYEDWSLYANKLNQETIKDNIPQYSKMVIILESCYSGDTSMGDATIENAFLYADAWANWGTGFNGMATGKTDDPHILNPNLAGNIHL